MNNRERFEFIDARLNQGILLYGAGVNGQWCLEYCKRIGLMVLAFIDGNSSLWGSELDGVICLSYEQYLEKYNDYVVLVTSKHHAKEILESKQNENMMSFDTWFVLKHMNQYNSLTFEDEKSNTVLSAIKNCMLFSDESLLWDVAEVNQFFCMAPFFNAEAEVFVDLGACTGDTIERYLVTHNGVCDRIYAFEPGGVQRDALQARINRLIQEWAIDASKFTVVEGATGDREQELYLITRGDLMSSCVSAQYVTDCQKVRVYKLDNFFGDTKVDFIKFDIEGAEYETILGAEQIIKRYRPKLAISVYHRPDDLLRIYQKFVEWNVGYKFKLRHHSSLLMETVLYCYY